MTWPRHNPRAFVLMRDEDETGVSGTGVVAEGVEFTDGTVALRWTSQWPTSVVFHDRGIEAVKVVHGHGGKTRIVWVDELAAEPACICSIGFQEAAVCRIHGRHP